MNDKKWLELFDNTKDKFKWFFIEYGYESVWDELNILRGQESQLKMISLMNRVWYQLPDNKFNIMENPAGWSEFLTLLENE